MLSYANNVEVLQWRRYTIPTASGCAFSVQIQITSLPLFCWVFTKYLCISCVLNKSTFYVFLLFIHMKKSHPAWQTNLRLCRKLCCKYQNSLKVSRAEFTISWSIQHTVSNLWNLMWVWNWHKILNYFFWKLQILYFFIRSKSVFLLKFFFTKVGNFVARASK